MNQQSVIIAAMFLLCTPEFWAQSNSHDSTFLIPPGAVWTDTGLELQPGEVVDISASAPLSAGDNSSLPACNPAGIAGLSQANLPLLAAAPGALIARLHAQGALPLMVGSSSQLHIEEASHLFLGTNLSSVPACQGTITVKVHRAVAGAAGPGASGNSTAQSLVSNSTTAASQPATTASTSTAATGGAGQKTRGEQLKSQLSTAAGIFMSGQFGTGTKESSTGANVASGGESGEAVAPTPVLKLSEAPLDSGLRTKIESLPRRVNDQFQNLGDMVNFVIVGSQKDVQAALEAANWHVADTSNTGAVLSAVMATYQKKDYLTMPMSTLYLFGRKQDFGYEMAEPIAMVASRHHFRIWKAPFTWQNQEVWVGAGTHDIAFAKDKRNGSVTHKIDPAVDGERDNIGASLQKANKTKTLSYYLPANPVQDAKNATGDGYHSDGRLLVILLQ